jgi:hypothetical protein
MCVATAGAMNIITAGIGTIETEAIGTEIESRVNKRPAHGGPKVTNLSDDAILLQERLAQG